MVNGMQTNPLPWARVTLVGLLLSLLVGCSLLGRGKAHPIVNDTALGDAVENALRQEPSLQGAKIQVRSAQGIIELTGPVQSVAVKSRAGLVAASVPGVVQVHNDLLTPP